MWLVWDQSSRCRAGSIKNWALDQHIPVGILCIILNFMTYFTNFQKFKVLNVKRNLTKKSGTLRKCAGCTPSTLVLSR